MCINRNVFSIRKYRISCYLCSIFCIPSFKIITISSCIWKFPNWRSILDTGAIIGTGSDYPVSYFNPMLGIHAGVTRTQDDGHPEGGWIPEQRITLAECIRAYTYGSACIFNRESELGTLEKGKLADITVLDRNLFEIPTHEILETKPVMTMTGGKIVFEKS